MVEPEQWEKDAGGAGGLGLCRILESSSGARRASERRAVVVAGTQREVSESEGGRRGVGDEGQW